MKSKMLASLLFLFSMGISGIYAQDLQGNLGLGVFSGPNKLIGGKSDDAMVGGWAGLNLFYGISNRLTLETNVAAGWTFIRCYYKWNSEYACL